MQDLLTAVALLLIIEGIPPFLSPRTLRKTLFAIVQQNDKSLRWTGLVSMLVGVGLLYLIRQGGI
jgi:hypothetical protein